MCRIGSFCPLESKSRTRTPTPLIPNRTESKRRRELQHPSSHFNSDRSSAQPSFHLSNYLFLLFHTEHLDRVLTITFPFRNDNHFCYFQEQQAQDRTKGRRVYLTRTPSNSSVTGRGRTDRQLSTVINNCRQIGRSEPGLISTPSVCNTGQTKYWPGLEILDLQPLTVQDDSRQPPRILNPSTLLLIS